MIFFDPLFDLIKACRHSGERHATGLSYFCGYQRLFWRPVF
jgi:hypothetical protein